MKRADRTLTPTAALLAGALLFGACASQEQDPVLKTWEQQQVDSLFKLVDENGDGEVTAAEFQKNYVGMTWQFFDRNGDGVITFEEWAIEGRSEARDQWFRDLDADGDGQITREEFEAARSPEAAARFFSLMDKSADGVITRKDLQRS